MEALLRTQFFEASINRRVSSPNELDTIVCIATSRRVPSQTAPPVNDRLDPSQWSL